MYNRAGKAREEEKRVERPGTAPDILEVRYKEGYADLVQKYKEKYTRPLSSVSHNLRVQSGRRPGTPVTVRYGVRPQPT